MGILRSENRRYNAHFVFYKPIKISPIKLVAPSRFYRGFIARLSSAKTDASNPNILRAYAHVRGISKKYKTFCKESLDICRRCEYIYARKKAGGV